MLARLLFIMLVLALPVRASHVDPECLRQMIALLGPGGDVLEATPSLDALEPTVLRTARLELRTPRRYDLPELLPIFRHGPTVRFTWFDWGDDFWNLGRIGVRYDTFAADALLGKRHDFMIRRQEGAVLVGRCALYQGVGPGSWEFGITLHQPHWGNKYAPEAVEEILRYVCVDLRDREVRFRTEPENENMLKQYERLGIPKIVDAADDVPEPPLFHRYHHFAISCDAWRATHR